MRDRRRGEQQRPPSEDDNATWRLLWALVGAVTFTVIMFFLELI
jgi:hypothetical protein